MNRIAPREMCRDIPRWPRGMADIPWHRHRPSSSVTAFDNVASAVLTKRRAGTDREPASSLETHPRCSTMVGWAGATVLIRVLTLCAGPTSHVLGDAASGLRLTKGGTRHPGLLLRHVCPTHAMFPGNPQHAVAHMH